MVMNMTRLSKVSFFLFVTVYNYLWMRIILFYFFYNHFGSMGLYFTALLAVIVLLFLVLVPKKLMNKNYREEFKKSIFKYIYVAFILLESIFGVSYCAYLLSTIFIPDANFFYVLIVISLALIFLSKRKTKDIMEIATLFIIVGYVILLITLFVYPNLDFTLLLPLKEINYWLLPLFALMVLGDNFTLLINKDGLNFSKMQFILAIGVAFCFFALEYFLLICNAGAEFFKGLDWVGFICLSVEPITQYFGNFDFAYLYYIVLCCIFKYAFGISLVRENIQMNSKAMSILLLIILAVLGSICFMWIPMDSTFMFFVFCLLVLSFSIFFWFLKECYHVRKTKD